MSPEAEGPGEAREVMDRAIRRLGILEHLFLGLAAVTALLAGALVAWLLGQAFGLPFRTTWAASALLLFIIPAAISWWQVRRDGDPSPPPPHGNPDSPRSRHSHE